MADAIPSRAAKKGTEMGYDAVGLIDTMTAMRRNSESWESQTWRLAAVLGRVLMAETVEEACELARATLCEIKIMGVPGDEVPESWVPYVEERYRARLERRRG